MKIFIIGVLLLLSLFNSIVSYATNVEDDIVWNSIKSNIDHSDIMISITIKNFCDFTKATNHGKLQSSTLDAIRSLQNFRNICSHIRYILSTREFIKPSKFDEYYKFILSILPHFYHDLRIEYEDLNRKSMLLNDKSMIRNVRKAQHTMMNTLNEIKKRCEF